MGSGGDAHECGRCISMFMQHQHTFDVYRCGDSRVGDVSLPLFFLTVPFSLDRFFQSQSAPMRCLSLISGSELAGKFRAPVRLLRPGRRGRPANRVGARGSPPALSNRSREPSFTCRCQRRLGSNITMAGHFSPSADVHLSRMAWELSALARRDTRIKAGIRLGNKCIVSAGECPFDVIYPDTCIEMVKKSPSYHTMTHTHTSKGPPIDEDRSPPMSMAIS